MKNQVRLICVLGLLLSARAATAQLGLAAFEDVIELRDGTILRGRVTELRPGDHVEIVLLDGRSQMVQWGEIVSSVGPSFPQQRRQLADRYLQPSPGREPVIVESTGPSLTVGVLTLRPMIGQETQTTDDGVNLEQLTMDWQSRSGIVVCTATPCRIYAPPGELMIQSSGPGILGSTVGVTVEPGGVRVKLRAPTVLARRHAGALFGASLAGVVGGPILLGLGAAFSADRATTGDANIYYGLGGALLGVGAILAVTGIVLLAINRPGIASIEPLNGTVHF
ncbi:MAG TPA: hypothetical protein VFF06_22430 [Polyangia bacterium]|nr:hypothetical protein [Polyangia bacterium]